jgi:hypothetical protein
VTDATGWFAKKLFGRISQYLGSGDRFASAVFGGAFERPLEQRRRQKRSSLRRCGRSSRRRAVEAREPRAA